VVVKISWYPPDSKEKEEKLGKFFQTTAAPPKALERIPKILEDIKKNNPNIKEFGIMGVSDIPTRGKRIEC